MDEMVKSIIAEMELRKPLFPHPIHTIYFGGGTPSILPETGIAEIMDSCGKLYDLTELTEVTLEANPEDISPAKLLAWQKSGINRLSIGIQTLGNDELLQFNRCHTTKEATTAVELALGYGIRSINVDLIFGSPWLTHSQWEKNMAWAFDSGADHISAYALTVEPKTQLAHQIKKGIAHPTSEKHQSEQYGMLYQKAKEQDWDFYEISNLSKPGHRAQHNSAYWSNQPYLGFGPGAHSYDTGTRSWNIANNAKYIEQISLGLLPMEFEKLSAAEIYNECVMTQLRLGSGLDLEDLEKMATAGVNIEKVKSELESWTNNGLAKKVNQSYVLTLEGRLICDHLTTQIIA